MAGIGPEGQLCPLVEPLCSPAASFSYFAVLGGDGFGPDQIHKVLTNHELKGVPSVRISHCNGYQKLANSKPWR